MLGRDAIKAEAPVEAPVRKQSSGIPTKKLFFSATIGGKKKKDDDGDNYY